MPSSYKSFNQKRNSFETAYHNTFKEKPSKMKIFSNSGDCGLNVSYVFEENLKLLNIFGNGPMNNYTVKNIPWKSILELIETVNISYGVTSIGNSSFGGCTNLKKVYISNSVQFIGDNSFNRCDSLQHIDIPDSIHEIGNCFTYCHNLVSISIGKNLSIIGRFGFVRGCDKLKSFNVSNLNPYYHSIDGILFSKSNKTLVCYPSGIEISSYSIPSGVTNLRKYAFGNCPNLKTITIPNSLVIFEYSSFGSLVSLESFIVNDDNPKLISLDGILFTKESPESILHYPSKKTDKYYTIPSFVKSIQVNAFHKNDNIECISIGPQVNTINSGSFSDCSNLNSLVYLGLKQPKNTIIGDPISRCSKLKEAQVSLQYYNSTFLKLPINKVNMLKYINFGMSSPFRVDKKNFYAS